MEHYKATTFFIGHLDFQFCSAIIGVLLLPEGSLLGEKRRLLCNAPLYL
jgi:hypothetical protein